MKLHLLRKFSIFTIFLAISFGFNVNPATSQEDPSDIYETDITEEMEVLDTGPVHEAYAETSPSETEPGIVVPKSPPDPINEIPPDQEGLDEDAKWISGYWAWDDDRNDFIWISGTWRVPPPGREWVPGHWAEISQGFQWISGYWEDISVAATEYLPEPPESMEEGPNAEAPSPDYAWVPGSWVWARGHYAWRPGYWAQMRPDWIWVPAYYVWTPFGYIYAGGYWDYPIVRRGVLFAPVYFHPPFFLRTAFFYRPRIVIGVNLFSHNLFVRPKYRHYYYGNYHAPRYHKRGIYPWHSKYARKRGHDPIYAHQKWKKRRHNSNREKYAHPDFRMRRDHESRRQPHIERGKKKNKNQHNKSIVKYKDKRRKTKHVEKNKEKVFTAKERNKKKVYQRRDDAKVQRHQKKNKHKNNKSIVKNKGKDRKIKHVKKTKEKAFRAKQANKKKVYQKENTKKVQRRRKEIEPQKTDKTTRRIVKRPKSIKVKPQKNSVAYKNGKNHDRKAPSYRNPKTRKPEPGVVHARNTPNKKYLKNKKYRKANRSQEPEVVEQYQNNRGQGPVNQRNHQINNSKGKKAYGQGRYSRNSNRGRNEQWLYNGKRK